MENIEKISEEKLRITRTTEQVEEVTKKTLEDRKAALLKDKENVENKIAEVDELLSHFSK